MSEIYRYLLAVISARHGVLIHGVTLMSTHEHIVLTDVRGCLPRFLAELHRIVALCVKVLRKWEGEVWDGGKTSVVELRTRDALVEKLAYVAANPVSAGLVERAEDWPGVRTVPKELGSGGWTAARPALYLDETNRSWPENTTLEFVLPPSLRMTKEEFQAAVGIELGRLEKEALSEIRAKGRKVLGIRKLRTLSPFARAKGREPLRARSPTFAVGRGRPKALSIAVDVVRAFRRAYRAALDAWRGGERTVLFPRATWFMHVFHGAAVMPR